jgi:hypothetical protein
MSNLRYGRVAAILVVAVAACDSSNESSDANQNDFSIGQLLPILAGKPGRPSMLPASYVSMSATDKQTALWNEIAKSEYCGALGDVQNGDRELDYRAPACDQILPRGGTGYAITALPALFALALTFDTPSDEMPVGRRKVVHSFGAAAKFELTLDYPDVPADATAVSRKKPYTGLLAPTGDHAPAIGIVRFSHGGGEGLTPAAAFKFFLPGRPSVNSLSTVSMNGQTGNGNFFANSTSNILPEPTGAQAILNSIFALEQSPGNHLQVKNLSAVTADGNDVAEGEQSAPYRIWWTAHGDLGNRFSSDAHEYRADLRTLEPGTVVYDVMASADPSDSGREKLGEVKITSHAIASDFGDYQLFFQHPRNR